MLIAKSYQGIGNNMLVANAIRVAWAYLVVFSKMLLIALDIAYVYWNTAWYSGYCNCLL